VSVYVIFCVLILKRNPFCGVKRVIKEIINIAHKSVINFPN
jgi:predicted TIM-barrel enzyme